MMSLQERIELKSKVFDTLQTRYHLMLEYFQTFLSQLTMGLAKESRSAITNND